MNLTNRTVAFITGHQGEHLWELLTNLLLPKEYSCSSVSKGCKVESLRQHQLQLVFVARSLTAKSVVIRRSVRNAVAYGPVFFGACVFFLL